MVCRWVGWAVFFGHGVSNDVLTIESVVKSFVFFPVDFAIVVGSVVDQSVFLGEDVAVLVG